MRQVEAQLKQQRPNLRVTLDVRVGDPAPGIAMAEITCGADLVVMATHGRTGIRRAVLGSVAGRGVDTSQCAGLTRESCCGGSVQDTAAHPRRYGW